MVWVMGATGKGITPKNKKQWHQLGAACNATGCRRERCGCFLEKLRTRRCHPAGEGDAQIRLLLSVHLFLSINIEKKHTLGVFLPSSDRLWMGGMREFTPVAVLIPPCSPPGPSAGLHRGSSAGFCSTPSVSCPDRDRTRLISPPRAWQQPWEAGSSTQGEQQLRGAAEITPVSAAGTSPHICNPCSGSSKARGVPVPCSSFFFHPKKCQIPSHRDAAQVISHLQAAVGLNSPSQRWPASALHPRSELPSIQDLRSEHPSFQESEYLRSEHPRSKHLSFPASKI